MAFRLAAMPEKYEEDIEELTSTWLDAVLYARISGDPGEMRVLCAACPSLSVPWVHLQTWMPETTPLKRPLHTVCTLHWARADTIHGADMDATRCSYTKGATARSRGMSLLRISQGLKS